MSAGQAAPRMAAVMFVDISGGAHLYETLGDAAAHARVDACLRLLARLAGEHGGRVIKTTGDGAMFEFATADAAIGAAGAMREAAAAMREADADALGIHIGCNAGLVIDSAGDIYGDAVNLAARLAGLAKPGQVLTTEEMATILSPACAERVRRLDRVAVKGKRDDVLICELIWQDADELTVMGTNSGAPRMTRLVLRHEGRELMLGAAGPVAATLGRDGSCDIVIADRKASRQHARIERRRDKFVLIDNSTNGTWVVVDGAGEVVLRREELILRRSGAIGFGHSPADADAAGVEFIVP